MWGELSSKLITEAEKEMKTNSLLQDAPRTKSMTEIPSNPANAAKEWLARDTKTKRISLVLGNSPISSSMSAIDDSLITRPRSDTIAWWENLKLELESESGTDAIFAETSSN